MEKYTLVITENYNIKRITFKKRQINLVLLLMCFFWVYSLVFNHFFMDKMIAKDSLVSVEIENKLLRAKTLALFYNSKRLTARAYQTRDNIKKIKAVADENEETPVCLLNDNYNKVFIEEEVLGQRIKIFKLKAGSRNLFNYSADLFNTKQLVAVMTKVKQHRENIQMIIDNKWYRKEIAVKDLGEDVYKGYVDGVEIFEVTREDALSNDIDGKALAQKYVETLAKEFQLIKEKDAQLANPLQGMIALVNNYSSLKQIDSRLESGLLVVENVYKAQSLEIADLYNNVAMFMANYAKTPSVYPLNYLEVTSMYGYRIHPIYKKLQLHSGMDFMAYTGTPIKSTAEGRVVFTGWFGGYGKMVKIYHGFGISTVYAHCDTILVRRGQYVKKGALIARTGDTGAVAGEHLHYEVRRWNQPIDPTPYLSRDIYTAKKDWR